MLSLVRGERGGLLPLSDEISALSMEGVSYVPGRTVGTAGVEFARTRRTGFLRGLFVMPDIKGLVELVVEGFLVFLEGIGWTRNSSVDQTEGIRRPARVLREIKS